MPRILAAELTQNATGLVELAIHALLFYFAVLSLKVSSGARIEAGVADRVGDALEQFTDMLRQAY